MGILQNDNKSVVSQCKVVVYKWKQESLPSSASNTALAEATPIDISSRILGASFTKSLDSPSGTFSVRLANNTGIGSGDWKDLIKPGTWCAIYMSQDGDLNPTSSVKAPNKTPKEKLRCIGYIERIAVKSEINSRGAFDISYELFGRDFGVVYEETTIWHDLFRYEKNLVDLGAKALKVVADITVDQSIKLIHDLFYAPHRLSGAVITGTDTLNSQARQWLLPAALIRDLNIPKERNKDTFYGNLTSNLNIAPSKASISISNPAVYLSGTAWDQLKTLSIPILHELYTELNDDGNPELVFRPIPWRIDGSRYRLIRSTILEYKDESLRVETPVPAIDVINFEVGEDNHARYNHFITTAKTSLINNEDNIALFKGSRFPKQNIASVKRHGFRNLHNTINTMLLNQALKDGAVDTRLLIQFNELLLDYWNLAVFAESGTLDKIGSNDIRIGKTLEFDENVPYISDRLYYIEEYTDTFEIQENGNGIWTQSLKLTRGFEKKDLNNAGKFSRRNEPFENEGEFTEENS